MARRFGKWLIVIGLVLVTGGHWALLQTVAWVGMTINFAQSEPVAVALEKTFNGQHPCRLCEFVAEGKKSDQQQEVQVPQFKLELFCELRPIQLFHPPAGTPPRGFVAHPHSRTDPPRLTPPRFA